KSVGDTITINVTVNDVTDLFSWQIAVEWDPTLLSFSSISLPSDHVFKGKSYLPAGPDFPEPGYLVYGVSLGPGQSSFSGSGRLCQIVLTIIKAPTSGQTLQCDISFENLAVDTFLLDSRALDISFTTVNAQYHYSQPWTPPPPATIYLNPEKIVDTSLTPGSTFNVNLDIINATDLRSWSVQIIFDKSILSTSDATEGDFLKSLGSTSFYFQQTTLNATHNVLYLNCSLTMEVGKSGNGNLAEIAFQVLELGSTKLVLNDVELLNPAGLQLPYISKSGFFSNTLIAKLSIEPPEVRGSEYTPGSTFKINVTLSDVESLKTCVFNLTYNPLIIQEINISVPSVSGQSPVKKLVVDDVAGYIWANLTYRNGISVYGSAVIMNVEFQVIAAGVSPINLTQTELFGLNNEVIVHEVYHGIFIGLIRDVAVIHVESDLSMAYKGWQVNISVVVKNKGNITETFDLIIYANSSQILEGIVTNLEPNEERTISMLWDTSTVEPCNFYKISAQAEPVPYEINTADNFLENGHIKIRFMGDVTGDGKVDMRDVNAAVQAFRAYPGRPLWNPELDLDRNNIIDMKDILIIILNFNKGC
ncbi:MAG: cohesin domain-containing protein, partial [Candidatus Bathyarchaeia archaeon]